MEPLRKFLLESLAEEPVKLKEGQIIAEAVVVYRLVRVCDDGQLAEQYEYTVTLDGSMASALGMLDIATNIITEYHMELLAKNREEDDSDD